MRGLLGVSWGIIWGPLEEVVDESSSDVVTVESVEDVAKVDEEKFMVVCVVEMFSGNNDSRVKFTSILAITISIVNCDKIIVLTHPNFTNDRFIPFR